VFDLCGQLVMRKQIKRLALNAVFEQLPRCIVGMETCLSAHYVSRILQGMGFEPRIIPAIYVKPFNKGQKNDYNDAEAIAEAALRPNLRTVPEKGQDQLDFQALHRVRARLVSRRTATINQIRTFLIEQGITCWFSRGTEPAQFCVETNKKRLKPRRTNHGENWSASRARDVRWTTWKDVVSRAFPPKPKITPVV